MKVAIFQTSPILLDVKANLEDVISKIHQGREKGAQLVVFPELALTGYFVGQRYHEAALRLDSEEVKQLVSATEGIAAVIGFIEESPSMNFYNSALVVIDREIAFAYRKLNLPNYGVFEERKYFSAGKHMPVFKVNDFSIAVFICNDMWHPSLPYLAVTQKADIFVTIYNSSQGSMGSAFSNIESWAIINSFYSRIYGVYNICANRVGEEGIQEKREDGPDESFSESGSGPYRFWGGSEVLNPFGQIIVQAKMYEPDEIYAVLSRNLLRQKKILLPYLRNDDPFFTHRELHRILYEKEPIETR